MLIMNERLEYLQPPYSAAIDDFKIYNLLPNLRQCACLPRKSTLAFLSLLRSRTAPTEVHNENEVSVHVDESAAAREIRGARPFYKCILKRQRAVGNNVNINSFSEKHKFSESIKRNKPNHRCSVHHDLQLQREDRDDELVGCASRPLKASKAPARIDDARVRADAPVDGQLQGATGEARAASGRALVGLSDPSTENPLQLQQLLGVFMCKCAYRLRVEARAKVATAPAPTLQRRVVAPGCPRRCCPAPACPRRPVAMPSRCAAQEGPPSVPKRRAVAGSGRVATPLNGLETASSSATVSNVNSRAEFELVCGLREATVPEHSLESPNRPGSNRSEPNKCYRPSSNASRRNAQPSFPRGSTVARLEQTLCKQQQADLASIARQVSAADHEVCPACSMPESKAGQQPRRKALRALHATRRRESFPKRVRRPNKSRIARVRHCSELQVPVPQA
ncbi:hypothetical protein ON010_g4026 [Phytophthora cinnamomi]|nr:hypothetical protein ON010_g4026 [Phytophthora cinnamomi]